MQVSVGPLLLDKDKKLLFNADRVLVSDNPRLLNVFILLVDNEPEIVSRKQIIDLLWPDESISDWAVSRVIADLRSTLADAGCGELIKTVHGKGFRLVAPVEALPAEQIDKTAQRQSPILAVSLTILVVLGIGFFALQYKVSDGPGLPDAQNETGIHGYENQESIDYPSIAVALTRKEATHLPLDDGWWTSAQGGPDYSENELSYQSPGTIGITLAHNYHGPDFLHGANLNMRVSLDNTYIESNKGLYLFTHQMGGEWLQSRCYFEDLSAGPNDYSCRIDAPGLAFVLGDDEYAVLGINGENDYSRGRITVHSAWIDYPLSVPMDQGWYTIPPRPLHYNSGASGGVSFEPNNRSQNLALTLAGPLKLQNATLSFTFVADQAYIDSGAEIQPYAQRVMENWDGEWQCWLSNEDILPGGMTTHCQLSEAHPIFNILEGEYLEIGLRTYGQKVNGKISIHSVSISCSEAFPRCGLQTPP